MRIIEHDASMGASITRTAMANIPQQTAAIITTPRIGAFAGMHC